MPAGFTSLRSSKFAWSPNFAPQSQDDCSPFRKLTATSTLEETANYIRHCEKAERLSAKSLFTQSREMLTLNYPLLKSHLGRTVQFKLKGGITVRGHLLLKGNVKRPLVILRTGIFSSLGSAVAERFIPMSLFDEGPFHLLILPSMTGTDFIQDNSEFAYGGFEEGIETLEVLRLIRNKQQPINDLFADFYTVGISMGGHSIMWTNLLASRSKDLSITRSLLYCPLTNLADTDKLNRDRFLKTQFIDWWANKRLKPLGEKFGSIISEEDKTSRFAYKNLFNYFQAKYAEPLVGWPPEFEREDIPSNPTFNTLNNYLQWWKHKLTVETLVLYTPMDPAVPAVANSQALKAGYANQNENLQIVEMPQGIHCSLPTTYNWSFISGTLRNFFQEKGISQEVSWSQAFSGNFARELHNSKFEIKDVTADPKSERVSVTLTLYKDKNWCIGNLQKLPKICKLQSFNIKIPKTSFDFEWDHPTPEITSTLRRWLSSHLQIREQPDGFWLVLYRPERNPSAAITDYLGLQKTYGWH